MAEWGGVALDGPGEDWVVVDLVRIEGEGGEAEEEDRRGCKRERKFGYMECCFFFFLYFWYGLIFL